MKIIRHDNGKEFELRKNQIATIDYELFSPDMKKAIPSISGLEMVRNENNLELLNQDKHKGVKVDVIPMGGNSFVGIMSQKSIRYNSQNGEGINVNIIDEFSEMLVNKNVNISDLIPSDIEFDWDFDGRSNLPTEATSDSDGWFLTFADFAGLSESIDRVSYNTPIYPANPVTLETRGFWTISVKDFFEKAFAYASQNDFFMGELASGVQSSDVYLFFPARYSSIPNKSRDFGIKLYNEKNCISAGISVIANDMLEQAQTMALHGYNGYVVGKTSTIYNLRVYGSIRFDFMHYQTYYDDGNSQYTDEVVSPTSGKKYAVLVVRKYGNVIGKIRLGELNSVSEELSFDGYINNIELRAAENLRFAYGVEFEQYTWNYYNGLDPNQYTPTQKIWNGIRCVNEWDELLPDSTVEITNIVDNGYDGTMVGFSETKRLVPASFQTDTHGQYIETINLKSSVAQLDYPVIDIIKDVIKRFNLVYVKTRYGYTFEYYGNRYSTNPTVVYDDLENWEYNEVIDVGNKMFNYKNDRKGDIVTKLEKDGNVYTLGDVINEEISEYGKTLTINLMSTVGYPSCYGEKEDSYNLEMLNLNSDDRYWGIGVNKQLDAKNIPIMVGFRNTDLVEVDLRLPVVKMFETTKDEQRDDEWFTTYQRNGNNPISVTRYYHYPTYNNGEKDNLLRVLYLGGLLGKLRPEIDGYPLVNNFKPVVKNYESDIFSIELPLTMENIQKIVDDGVIIIGDKHMKVLKVDGVMLDYDLQVIKITGYYE